MTVNNYYKYRSYKVTKYQSIYQNKKVDARVPVRDLTNVVILGGVFEKIGDENEAVGGGNQKMGSSNQ